MTIWEFQACVDGWVAANSSKEEAPPPMDEEMLAELGIEGFYSENTFSGRHVTDPPVPSDAATIL